MKLSLDDFWTFITAVINFELPIKSIALLAGAGWYLYRWIFVRNTLDGWWKGELTSDKYQNLKFDCDLYLFNCQGKEIQGKVLYVCSEVKNEATTLYRGIDYISNTEISMGRSLFKNGISLTMYREFTDQGLTNDVGERRDKEKNPKYVWSCTLKGFFNRRPSLNVSVERLDIGQTWVGSFRKER